MADSGAAEDSPRQRAEALSGHERREHGSFGRQRSSTIKQGYLLKKINNKHWKPRYVVLKGAVLYEHEVDSHKQVSREVAGQVSLHNTSMLCNRAKSKFIVVDGATKEHHAYRAESAHSMAAWVSAVSEVQSSEGTLGTPQFYRGRSAKFSRGLNRILTELKFKDTHAAAAAPPEEEDDFEMFFIRQELNSLVGAAQGIVTDMKKNLLKTNLSGQATELVKILGNVMKVALKLCGMDKGDAAPPVEIQSCFVTLHHELAKMVYLIDATVSPEGVFMPPHHQAMSRFDVSANLVCNTLSSLAQLCEAFSADSSDLPENAPQLEEIVSELSLLTPEESANLESALRELGNLGFPRDAAERALRDNDYNIYLALATLLSGNAPSTVAPSASEIDTPSPQDIRKRFSLLARLKDTTHTATHTSKRALSPPPRSMLNAVRTKLVLRQDAAGPSESSTDADADDVDSAPPEGDVTPQTPRRGLFGRADSTLSPPIVTLTPPGSATQVLERPVPVSYSMAEAASEGVGSETASRSSTALAPSSGGRNRARSAPSDPAMAAMALAAVAMGPPKPDLDVPQSGMTSSAAAAAAASSSSTTSSPSQVTPSASPLHDSNNPFRASASPGSDTRMTPTPDAEGNAVQLGRSSDDDDDNDNGNDELHDPPSLHGRHNSDGGDSSVLRRKPGRSFRKRVLSTYVHRESTQAESLWPQEFGRSQTNSSYKFPPMGCTLKRGMRLLPFGDDTGAGGASALGGESGTDPQDASDHTHLDSALHDLMSMQHSPEDLENPLSVLNSIHGPHDELLLDDDDLEENNPFDSPPGRERGDSLLYDSDVDSLASSSYSSLPHLTSASSLASMNSLTTSFSEEPEHISSPRLLRRSFFGELDDNFDTSSPPQANGRSSSSDRLSMSSDSPPVRDAAQGILTSRVMPSKRSSAPADLGRARPVSFAGSGSVMPGFAASHMSSAASHDVLRFGATPEETLATHERQLLDMGFDRPEVQGALLAADGDFHRALELLLRESGQVRHHEVFFGRCNSMPSDLPSSMRVARESLVMPSGAGLSPSNPFLRDMLSPQIRLQHHHHVDGTSASPGSGSGRGTPVAGSGSAPSSKAATAAATTATSASSSAAAAANVQGEKDASSRTSDGGLRHESSGNGSGGQAVEDVFSAEGRNLLLKKEKVRGREVLRVRGGTVPELVEHLISDKNNDPDFLASFVVCHTTFTDASTLLEILIGKHVEFMDMLEANCSTEGDVRAHKRACGLLVKIIASLWKSLSADDVLRLHIIVFDLVRVGYLDVAQSLRNELLELRNAAPDANGSMSESTGQAPSPLAARKVYTRQSTIMDVPCMDIAKQLTKVDSEMFCSIRPSEILAWSKKQSQETSPNIFKLISRFNAISQWCATLIVTELKIKTRVEVLRRIIDIMKCLRKLRNFNSLMALLSGVNCAAVHRLTHTLEMLGARQRASLEKINTLMSHERSFATYRAVVSSCQLPAIPYLGLFLTDITFVQQGNPDLIPLREGSLVKLVNYSKRYRLHAVIQGIQHYQSVKMPISKKQDILDLLGDFEHQTHEQLFALSKHIEPRNAALEDIE
eukprot:m.117881 g.117881  ORF g.117881 m.117881 type:complete len:1579 (+) comp9523_c0_seq4:72-4808(+)